MSKEQQQQQQQPIDQEAIQSALAELAGLEREFEKVDVEILRETTIRQTPLFARRNALTSRIHNFWPLVFEQASSALQFDEFVTPEDAHVLGRYLRSVTVTRPDLAAEPRTVQIDFGFSDNEYFSDSVLSKRFTYQGGGGGGLASEPVPIAWRAGKDLTEGATAAAAEEWRERCSERGGGEEEGRKRLERVMERGPASFFNWFAWTGRHEALGEVHVHEHEGECGGSEDGEGFVEVFPNGDEVAVQIAEDMYPNAPKYFTESLEDDDEEDEDEIELDSEEEKELAKGSAMALLSEIGKKGGGKRNGVGETRDAEDDGPAKKKSKK